MPVHAQEIISYKTSSILVSRLSYKADYYISLLDQSTE